MVSDYQRTVYEAVKLIPVGRVSTYARISRLVGAGSPRSAGQALKKNPFAPDVPCHRVISSDLTMGGFCGRRSGPEVERKLRLLAEEGVIFAHGKLADPSRLWP